MLEILSQTTTILILCGVALGFAGVVVGGTMFFSIPLFQWLFPEASFGVIVGNIKMGSFVRGIGSTASTAHKIEWKACVLLSIFPFLATILGVFFIASLNQKWLFPIIIFAVCLAELAPRVAPYITQKKFTIASIFSGVYAGVFGAGISIILMALLRLKHPLETQIAFVKTQARFIEWLLVISAVLTHFWHQNLILEIWFPWATGTLIGGLLGGLALNNLSHLSGKTQKYVLRTSFALAITIAGINFFEITL